MDFKKHTRLNVIQHTIRTPTHVQWGDTNTITRSNEAFVTCIKKYKGEHPIQHIHKFLSILFILVFHMSTKKFFTCTLLHRYERMVKNEKEYGIILRNLQGEQSLHNHYQYEIDVTSTSLLTVCGYRSLH